MKVFYSDKYTIPLPLGHKFPISKYRLIKDGLLERGVLRNEELFECPLADISIVKLAHDPEYVDAVIECRLDPKMVRRIGFPQSEALPLRSLATVGGALSAAEEALENGVSGNLAGGTHHAFYDLGEGFCVFNDFAVVIMSLLSQRKVKRVAIVDLDVHQGNGNSSMLASLDNVFVFSMHGENNYPFHKIPSTLDIALPDNADDDTVLSLLYDNFKRVLAFEPDIILYQHGSDMLKEDAFGRLSMTLSGLAQRDRFVFNEAKQRGIPVSLGQGGGYAKPIEVTVEAHIQTYSILKDVYELI